MQEGETSKAELASDSVSSSVNPSADGAGVEGDENESESENDSVSASAAAEAALDASIDQGILREMIIAGLCYGRSKAKTHPRMKTRVFATRNGIELIDVAQTWQALQAALEAVKKTVADGQQILLVGTQPSAHESVRTLAEKFGFPYVVNRWLGGTLTNFKTISRRIEYFKKLKADRAAGLLEKYTKKERLGIDRKIQKMDVVFRGVEQMGKLPGLVIAVNANLHAVAIHEAHLVGIPVLAIMSSDSDPHAVEHPVPANDNSTSSIAWLFAKFEEAADEGRKEAAERASAQAAKTTASGGVPQNAVTAPVEAKPAA